ncbi:MAG: hypothetical protein AB1421_12680 [Pseudomonadota bacterium]
MPHLPYRFMAALALGLSLVVPSAQAVESACQPILEANKAKFSAPAFHDKMYDRPKANTPTGEFIKVGNKGWMKTEQGWMAVPPAMLKKMQNINADNFGMHNCKGLGMVGIRPARVYGWDLKVAGKLYTGSKLTVAYDGLPTKVETPEGAYTVTSYNGVVAPISGK